MKKLKKILLWFFLVIITIILGIFIFRNDLFLLFMKIDQSGKWDTPFTMLELPEINDSLYMVLATDFHDNATDPYQYIVNEFNDHDIIFLGENHRIRHDLIFVQNLIPVLYANGIRNMGFEFALMKDSALIREVITNKSYFDQKKANQIIFDLSPYWGYKEYIDIFRAAWELNRSIPEEEDKFMIYGIMHDYDFSELKKRSDEYDEDVMLRVRKGIAEPEQFMADCIIEDFVEKNKKALIYCGIHHAFTGYQGYGKRVGVIVKDKIGDKAMTISLHYPWKTKNGSPSQLTYPVNGFIDSFIRRYESETYAFGINVNNTAFGDLTDTSSSYIENGSLALRSFCDGYIYLNSFSSSENVSVQKDFINGDNFQYAKAQFPNPELREGILRFFGPKVYNQIPVLDADIKFQFRYLY